MRQVRNRLTDDGLLSLSFVAGRVWVGKKIFSMLQAAFGHEPKVFAYPSGAYGRDGQIFVINKNPNVSLPDTVPGFVNLTEEIRDRDPVPTPEDDWPYLYYKDKKLHKEYLITIAILIAVSGLMVFLVIPKANVFYTDSFMFFFLGAGFLLLEVRNITALALIYGSTWIVWAGCRMVRDFVQAGAKRKTVDRVFAGLCPGAQSGGVLVGLLEDS